MDASTSLECAARVPLVIRVKRTADEEPLDVLRLRNVGRKFARGAHGAFALENLEFQRAGTILDSENISSRTAHLTRSSERANPVDTVSESTFSTTEPSVKKFEKRHILKVSRSFRPVVSNLGTLDKELANLATETLESSEEARLKRQLEDDHTYSVGSASGENISYNLCDLEICSASTFKNSSRKRRRGQPTNEIAAKITCNDEELIVETTGNPAYVYDVYTLKMTDENEETDVYDQIVDSLNDVDLILGTASENDLWNNDVILPQDYVEEIIGDEEDSNDENNWRNDYPEAESEADSGEEDDIDEYSESGTEKIKKAFSQYRQKIIEESDLEDEDDQ